MASTMRRLAVGSIAVLVGCLAGGSGGAAWAEAKPTPASVPQPQLAPPTKPTEKELLAAEQREISRNIVNGGTASEGEYPYFAWIRGVGICGATLISSTQLVTAAHCVQGTSPGFSVAIGGRTNGSDPNQGITRTVSSINIHPSYPPAAGLANDVAVLTLNTPVTNAAQATNTHKARIRLRVNAVWCAMSTATATTNGCQCGIAVGKANAIPRKLR